MDIRQLVKDLMEQLKALDMESYIDEDSTLDRNKRILERLVLKDNDFMDTLEPSIKAEINASGVIDIIRSKQKEIISNILRFDYTIPRQKIIKHNYKEMLNECYKPVSICGHEYQAGEALESVDPIAYRCGLADYESEQESELNNDDLEED